MKLSQLLSQIAGSMRSNEVAFFLGAGISHDSPANLPLAAGLNSEIIAAASKNLGPSIKLSRSLRKKLISVRPEVLLELLYESIGPPALDVLDVLKTGKPNSIHVAAAELAVGGFLNLLLTTNFDSLVETAFYQLDSSCAQIITEVQFSRFRRSLTRTPFPLLFKLHGSLQDVAGRDQKSSIQATLAQVGKPIGEAKTRFLKYVLKNYDLVFLGYSGLDDFDIFPILATTSSGRRLYWIEHTAEKSSRIISADEIRKSLAREIQGSNVDKIVANRKFGFKVLANTADLVKKLRLQFHELPRRRKKMAPSHPSASKQVIAEWTQTSGLAKNSSFFIGRLMSQINQRREAANFYRYALKHSPKKDRPSILRFLGDTHVRLSEFNKARIYLEKCLKSIPAHDLTSIGSMLVNLGWMQFQEGDFDDAIATLRASLRCLPKDNPRRAAALNNLAVVYYRRKQWTRALNLYRQSLEIKIRNGDIQGSAGTYDNIGLVFASKKNYSEAEKYHNRSLDLYRSIGDTYGMSQTLDSLGELLSRKDDYPRAIRYFEDSLRLKKLAGDQQTEAVSLINLAEVLRKAGRSITALACLHKAEAIARKIGAKREIALSRDLIRQIAVRKRNRSRGG